MSSLERMMEQNFFWTTAALWFTTAVLVAVWAVLFALHGAGKNVSRDDAPKWSFPPPGFWKRVNPKVSVGLAVICAVLSGLLFTGGVAEVSSWDNGEDDKAIAAIASDIDGLMSELKQTARDLVTHSHRQAIEQNNLRAWADELIRSARENDDPSIITFAIESTEDPAIQSDLLYCLQEAFDMDMGAQLGVTQSEAELNANLKRVRERFGDDDAPDG